MRQEHVAGESHPSGDAVGFLDIGSNAVRLVVARFTPGGEPLVEAVARRQVRLAEGAGVRARGALALDDVAVARAAQACCAFVAEARERGVARFVVIATSAVRDAEDREALLRRLREGCGLEVEVLSGLREARLIHRGLVWRAGLGAGRMLCLDIGGGSVELVAAEGPRVMLVRSLRLGVLRLTAEVFASGFDGVVDDARYVALQRIVRRRAGRAAAAVRRLAPPAAYGTAGTVRNLGAIAAHLRGEAQGRADVGRVLGPPFTLAELRRARALLCGLTLEQRRHVAGLDPERADLIVAGAAVLETLMDEIGLERIRHAVGSVRDGLVIEYAERHAGGR